jgi:hypothetical protein
MLMPFSFYRLFWGFFASTVGREIRNVDDSRAAHVALADSVAEHCFGASENSSPSSSGKIHAGRNRHHLGNLQFRFERLERRHKEYLGEQSFSLNCRATSHPIRFVRSTRSGASRTGSGNKLPTVLSVGFGQ